jgi:hypothetical protein
MDNQELKKILNNNAPADFDLEGVFGLMLACGNLIEQNARLNDELKEYTHLERIEHGRFVAESLKVENLRKENSRLREALERIANQDRVDPNAKYYAREALKGGE